MSYFKEAVFLFGVGQVLFGSEGKLEVFVACCLMYAFISGIELLREKADHKAEYQELITDMATLSDDARKLEGLNLAQGKSILAVEGTLAELQKSNAVIKAAHEENKKFFSQANLGLGFRATKREA